MGVDSPPQEEKNRAKRVMLSWRLEGGHKLQPSSLFKKGTKWTERACSDRYSRKLQSSPPKNNSSTEISETRSALSSPPPVDHSCSSSHLRAGSSPAKREIEKGTLGRLPASGKEESAGNRRLREPNSRGIPVAALPLPRSPAPFSVHFTSVRSFGSVGLGRNYDGSSPNSEQGTRE